MHLAFRKGLEFQNYKLVHFFALLKILNASFGRVETNEKMIGKQFFQIGPTEVIEFGYPEKGDNCVRGDSEAYSQLVRPNVYRNPPPPSDHPFYSYTG